MPIERIYGSYLHVIDVASRDLLPRRQSGKRRLSGAYINPYVGYCVFKPSQEVLDWEYPMEVAPESLAESKSWTETKSRKSIGSHGGESPSRKCIDGWTESTRRSGCGRLDAADGVNAAE